MELLHFEMEDSSPGDSGCMKMSAIHLIRPPMNGTGSARKPQPGWRQEHFRLLSHAPGRSFPGDPGGEE
jgi:hypothetical protein